MDADPSRTGAQLPDREQRTTPDAYPLSLNALRLACNQATNRDPSSSTTSRRSEARSTGSRAGLGDGCSSGPAGAAAAKYRHLLDEARALGAEISLHRASSMRAGLVDAGELEARDRAAAPFDGLGRDRRGARVLGLVSRRTAWLASRLQTVDPEERSAIEAALGPLARLLEETG